MSNLHAPVDEPADTPPKLRVVFVHNEYQLPGGEDEVVDREKRLLLEAGHEVSEYRRRNSEIEGYGLLEKATLPFRTIWARDSCQELKFLMKTSKPDIVHFHNTFPLISPATYYTCRRAGIPVIQSLYNPRLLCPAASFCRDSRVCEDCLGKTFPWPALIHACYRSSYTQSAVTATMLAFHGWVRTWQKLVDIYVTATEFYRGKFIAGGLPSDKVAVKPHFVEPDPDCKEGLGDYAVYISRLTGEKGVPTLLKAWSGLDGIPLKIRGEGPLYDEVHRFSQLHSHTVHLLPRLSRDELTSLLKGSRFLVWPSEGYYETFGLVAIESFACGVPVITSGLGAMGEVVEDGKTGLHFRAGDPLDLAAKVNWAWSHPEVVAAMGRAARAEYEAKYTSAQNYKILMSIYERALNGSAAGRGRSPKVGLTWK